MSRTRSVLLVLGIALLIVPESVSGTSLSRDTVRSFLRDHLPELHGTVVSERNDTHYVRFGGPRSSGRVEVYRTTTRSTEEGQTLVEKSLGTAIVRVEGNGPGTIHLAESDTNTLRPGDRFRPLNHTLTVHNRSEVADETLRRWLTDHRRIDSVRFVDVSPSEDQFALLLSRSHLKLQAPPNDPTEKSLNLDGQEESSVSEAEEPPGGTLLDRADFQRVIHNFEWVELPTRGSTQILMLAAGDAIGFARYDEGVRTTHWMEVSGTVLDVSFVESSSENPGELFVLAVTQHDDEVQTRAFTFNALDRSVRTHWTEPDVFLRRVGANRFILQKIGLNSPFTGDVTYVTVSRDGWNRDGSLSDPPQRIIPRGYAVSDSGFVFLDGTGRLTVQKNGSTWAKGVAQYGDAPGSISARRNDRSHNLHPSFPLRSSNRGYRTLMPENIASGMTFFQGLRTLRESRVYYLALRDGSVDTLWESRRLSGYVSGTDWYDGGYWLMLVNPDAETSTLKRFEPAQSNP